MTLVDTRPGIRAALLALAAETDRDIAADAIVATLGPPVAETLAPWFTEAELPHAIALFRGHMLDIGVQNVIALPGAGAALEATRAAGLAVLVVTGKISELAAATLEHAGLTADIVVGDLYAEDKATPLAVHHALAYVGDHPADMRAARTAGVPGIGVTSGSSTERELTDAGAQVVLSSLEQLDLGRLTDVARP